MSSRKPKLQDAYDAVAKSLVEFGYPDCTSKMVQDVHEAIRAGKPENKMPHGIVGAFAYSQVNEHLALFNQLKDRP